MNILVKFPTRGRPEKFKNTLQQYLDLSSGKHPMRFVCTFDEDDHTMNTQEMREYLDSLNIEISYHYGHSKNKIEAINANMENQDFDILLLAADDLIPIVPHYDDIIVEEMKKSPYGLDTSLFFVSSMWHFGLDVKCIMGKQYYDRFNYIYHPAYKSIACDFEYTNVAKMLGRQIEIDNHIIFHNFITDDDTAARNHPFGAKDDDIYWERKKNNFGLEPKDIVVQI